MKKLKMFFLIMISFFSLVIFFDVKTNALSGDYSQIHWSLDSEGVFTISGSGDMRLSGPIPWSAYKDKIKKIVADEGITSIYGRAFQNCNNLTCIELSSTINKFYLIDFLPCKNINEIIVSIDSSFLSCEDGVLFNKDKSVLVAYPCGKTDVVYSIPKSVLEIQSGAFAYCQNLNNVLFNNQITEVKEKTFFYCDNLKNIILPNGVCSIDGNAFYRCSKLSEIMLPETLTDINKTSFDYCDNLSNIFYAGSTIQWNTIHNNSKISPTFYNCLYDNGIIYNSKKTIVQSAFDNSIQKAEIPDGVQQIAQNAFSGCVGLESITIPKSLHSVGKSAFKDCIILSNVYYSGTKMQWEKISIGDDNDPLKNAEIEYNNYGFFVLTVENIGDVNKDGRITTSDARLVLRKAVGLENFIEEVVIIADVNQDGFITTADARLILRAAIGLENREAWL